MLPVERRNDILSLINQKNYLSLKELCQQLHFSESTLRRDLRRLEKDGFITCTRGGAIANGAAGNVETPMELRRSTNSEIKARIGRRAAGLVRDNQMLLLDASTTVMEMIPYLKGKKNLTIITCCLTTALLVAEQLDCTLICTGGKYHAATAALLGYSAESALDNWFADLMFFSVNSVDAQNGLTDQGEEIAHLKAAMLRHARRAILLADSSKFGHTSAYRLFPADVEGIVTNRAPLFDQDCWRELRSKMIFTEER
ncbi:MAG: DeoR/GlpR family DNA-binding transcription regulator [Eubacteriales bacterium]|nr:DeoR/GlpR family DNA-binding transcription regulator [Eubacteriales bacterium]